ncbi:hypothetical protein [Alicyclobacillus sp. SP_1]|uniref:hypothetical protein n=1 Tax=Alicyclobacillus sp. SP_1 TaxID=2942475 RepID=UPI0021580FE4|nr:hypothetical protein [Alicyclobacillus sp. SP_1]
MNLTAASTHAILHTYYLDLIQILVVLLFLVAFKLGLVWGMAKVSVVLSEEGAKAAKASVKKRIRPPVGFRALRYGMAGLLLLNGLLQIRPTMVLVHQHALDLPLHNGASAFTAMNLAFAHFWAAHALWLNIWMVVIQLAFAAMLLTFNQRSILRATAGVLIVFSLFLWVVAEGFGHFATFAPSFLYGAPGTALLMSVVASLLFLRLSAWKTKRLHRGLQVGLGVYWLLFGLLQWLPETKHWSVSGFQYLDHPIGLSESPSWFALAHQHLVASAVLHPVLMNLVFGMIAWMLAAGAFFIRRRGFTPWFVASTIWLLFLWLTFDGAGMFGAYVYPARTAPIVFVALLLTRLTRHNGLPPRERVED